VERGKGERGGTDTDAMRERKRFLTSKRNVLALHYRQKKYVKIMHESPRKSKFVCVNEIESFTTVKIYLMVYLHLQDGNHLHSENGNDMLI
jgi:hypothetical protein